MTAWRFTTNARIIRSVTVDDEASITVDETVNFWFGAQWIKTGRNLSGTDRGGPRRGRTDLLRYRTGFLAPAGGPLKPGDRVELEGVAYEVIEPPRDVHQGRSVVANEVPVMDVTRLYPMEGALAEQGGAPITPSVRFSIYSTDETHEVTGTYEDYTAETDISNHAGARINRHFLSGGRVYKITAAEVDLQGGYVRMTVRKSGVSE